MLTKTRRVKETPPSEYLLAHDGVETLKLS